MPKSIGLGFVVWLVLLAFHWPFTPFQLTYVELLILAAPLWLIPFIWQVENGLGKKYLKLALFSAIALTISFLLPRGQWAATLTLPWLLLISYLAIQAFGIYLSAKTIDWAKRCQLAAFAYLPVGAFWALCDRLDFQPLGFDPTIVLLTVAHFHYAGFILPWLCKCLLEFFPSRWAVLFSLGVVLGIPLVALGITTSHFHCPTYWESVFASIMAISAAGIGFLHLCLGWQHRQHRWAFYWILAGLALSVGMTLALLYGWRYYWPIPMINIPFMYALHGSLNALGFAIPASLGWYYFKSTPR
ncbi:MAG: YndJ family transporter [Bacteroidota bacterium]